MTEDSNLKENSEPLSAPKTQADHLDHLDQKTLTATETVDFGQHFMDHQGLSQELTSENYDQEDEDYQQLFGQAFASKGFIMEDDFVALQNKPQQVFSVISEIEATITNGDLHFIQIAHLRSGSVVKAIIDGSLTIKAAIERSEPARIHADTFSNPKLTRGQITGICMGLTFDQVGGIDGGEVYFSESHVQCVLTGAFSFSEIIPLTHYQAKGLLLGIPLNLVSDRAFTEVIFDRLKELNLGYEDYKELTIQQVLTADAPTTAEIDDPPIDKDADSKERADPKKLTASKQRNNVGFNYSKLPQKKSPAPTIPIEEQPDKNNCCIIL